MKALIITQEEPYYLPVFMGKVLGSYHNVAALITVAAKSKSFAFLSQVMDQYKIFGLKDSIIYGGLFLHHKVIDLLSRYIKTKRLYSVKAVAMKNAIPVYNLKNINELDSLQLLSSFAPDIIISIACPQIFRKDLINLSSYCINIHGALLPENRGRMPSFWTLAKGESVTGVTVHYINEGIDTGNVIVQKPIKITEKETWHSLQNKVAEVGATALLEALQLIESGDGAGTPQKIGGSYNSLPTKQAIKAFRARGRKFI
jgi:methionyl-tRNA formyltransferase